MNIDVEVPDGVNTSVLVGRAIIRLSGRFDANECADFRSRFDHLIQDGATSVAIDLADVSFADSAALAELVRAMKRCRERGGDLSLIGLSSAIQVIFELTGLDKAFTIESQ